MFDGILALRLRLLTNTLINDEDKLPYLDDFQRELDHFRPWHRHMKLPKERVRAAFLPFPWNFSSIFQLNLFESIFRVASGLNPLSVQTLFESAVKSLQTTSIDHLGALFLFCHFAPSTVFHYRTHFQRAASIGQSSKKNKDLSRLRQHCLTLIRQPYLTL